MASALRPNGSPGTVLVARTLPPDVLGPSRARLLTLSMPIMESLHQQLASSTLAVILTDRDGTIIAVVAPRGGELDPGALEQGTLEVAASDFSRTALPAPLIDNAHALPALSMRLPCMNDAPLSGRALALTADSQVVMGLSSPILAPDGGSIGIIDLCSSPFDTLSHAAALLRTTAGIIEHRLIEHDERGFLVLGFHPHASVLGTPLEALVLFARDSSLLAANQVATALLSIAHTSDGLRCPDCFDAQWAGLVGGATLQPDEAFTIHSCAGTPFFARARLCVAPAAPWGTP